jgi:hypothetical protein
MAAPQIEINAFLVVASAVDPGRKPFGLLVAPPPLVGALSMATIKGDDDLFGSSFSQGLAKYNAD